MGGLTCGSLLAQLRGLRVAVLEQHFTLGGFTHSFARPGGREWAMGLHYVGQMGGSEQVRAIMDTVTGGQVRWNPMPTLFERYHFPGIVVDQPAGRDAYAAMLVERWPEERPAIERYLGEIDVAYRWFVSRLPLGSMSPVAGERPRRAQSARARALCTTREALDGCGLRSPVLRAALTAQWGNYGVPPATSAFAAHATVVSHFVDGGWFPEGGSSGIADGARAAIEAAGGTCLVRHEVEQVLVEHRKAVGVRVRHGSGARRSTRELRAPLVISDAGAAITFERLLRDDQSPEVKATRAAIRALRIPASAAQLFLTFREPASTLGFHGENHWMFAGYDHDEAYARRNRLVDGQVNTAFLSFPSLKDPLQRIATAEIIAPIDRTEFDRWATLPWKRRGGEYERLKATISAALLAFVETHHPGFSALVEYAELATPLTVAHFTGNDDGAIYGLPAVPARFMTDALRVPTPVPGLMLTGADVCGQGIVGAMLGGVMTVGHILGAGGFERVLAFARTKGFDATPARPRTRDSGG